MLLWLLCSEPNREPPQAACEGGGRPAQGTGTPAESGPGASLSLKQAAGLNAQAQRRPETGPGARPGLEIVSSASGLGSRRLRCSRAGGGGFQGGDTRETIPGEKPAPASRPHRPRTLTREVGRGVGVLHLVDVRLKLVDFQLSERTRERDGENKACGPHLRSTRWRTRAPRGPGTGDGPGVSPRPGDRRPPSVPVSHPGPGSPTRWPSSRGAGQDAAPLYLRTAPPAPRLVPPEPPAHHGLDPRPPQAQALTLRALLPQTPGSVSRARLGRACPWARRWEHLRPLSGEGSP